jgi:NAD+ kinase
VKQVGIVYNPSIAGAATLADEAARLLKSRKLKASVSKTRDGSQTLAGEGCDLLLVLGGDGSILRAARAANGIPIIGINLGTVGFLAEAEPDGWQEVLSRILDGDHWIEERMMLRVTVKRGSEVVAQEDALNDAVVARGPRARIVRLRLEIDSQRTAQYAADGLIAATATGSTAYALAAGGPILSPEARSIVLVPVAPHLCPSWPLVLPEGSELSIAPTDDREATLTVDGDRNWSLSHLDSVQIRTSPLTTRFARVQGRGYFYTTLISRLVARRPD